MMLLVHPTLTEQNIEDTIRRIVKEVVARATKAGLSFVLACPFLTSFLKQVVLQIFRGICLRKIRSCILVA